MSHALEIQHLSRRFGALQVTNDVSFALESGARAALIGPNGAGKTTLINLMAGSLVPSSGSIWLQGRDVTRVAQSSRVHAGLIRTFQVTRLFTELSVEDNIRMAIVQQQRQSFRLWAPVSGMAAVEADLSRVLEIVCLQALARKRVRDLAYGEQRLVEIALALALKPRVLLLDEPAAGVPQSESQTVMSAIAALPEDIAILFIEHDMDLVFRFAQRILVLVAGTLMMDDTPATVAADPRVNRLYLGEAA